MATPPVSSITPPSPPTAPPPSTLSNVTSDTPPPSSPSTPAMSSPPPSQSPPPPDLQSPPPSLPVTPPPTTTPPQPPSSPPPSPPASPPTAPPPAATSSPPQILSPPPSSESSPPPPSKLSQPPPSKLSPPPPPESSPPSKSSPPPQPPPSETSPPLDFSPPPPEDTPRTPVSTPPPAPPEKSPTTPPSPLDPLSPTTSPSPPIVTSSPPPISFPTPPANSSTSGSLAPPLASLPTEKPTARSTTPGTNGTVTAMSPKGGGGGMKPGTAVAVGVVVGFLALSLVVMAVWYTKRRKKRNGSGYGGGYVMPSPFASSHNSDSLFMRSQISPKLAEIGSGSNFMFSSDPNSKSWFTYEELSDATQGFSSHKLLGEGGFGCVYKGLLVDGREVAVKQLKIGGGQGEREFKAEVEIISRVHHRYLVSLVGYCISDHQRLLVYEYLPNDTLHYHLHGEGRPVMEWSTRVKVAAGAARGIAYLHEDCQPRIIHRDIKSSNILLDNNFDARVADFGLAKLAADANTHVTTRVMGTFGYMAPEYASSGKLTEKSDVFSYGVVLLELITGRKSVDGSQPLGDESLVEWARPLLNEALENEKFEALIDPRLGNNYVELEMFRMIEAAAACIRHSAPKRPQMSQVVRAFDSMNEYPDLTNGMKLGQSEIYNSREHSAQLRMFQRLAFHNQGSSSEYDDHSHSSWKSSKLGSST